MNAAFLSKLDNARALAGIPFAVVKGGGWRSEAYQRAIYERLGKPPILDSYHLLGRAADVRYNSESDLYKIINAAWKSGIRGFGINRGAIHLDDRVYSEPSVWGYPGTENTALYLKTKKYIKSLPAKGTTANPPGEPVSFALPLLLATSLLILWKL